MHSPVAREHSRVCFRVCVNNDPPCLFIVVYNEHYDFSFPVAAVGGTFPPPRGACEGAADAAGTTTVGLCCCF